MTEHYYSNLQKYSLLGLRIGIGWHFLYEGLVKLANPNWSSVGYLLDSEGFLKNFFLDLASNSGILRLVDLLNVWGLILIGVSLLLGLLTRPAIIAGIVLLAFYYLSHPPFVGMKYAVPMEGSYLVVNKNLIELLALLVMLAFPTSREFGLDRFFPKKQKQVSANEK